MAVNGDNKRKADDRGGDGVTDFKVGTRDYSAAEGTTSKAIKADFESKSKTYTNGVVAKNDWKTFKGALTGETLRIPDVNSGYPKSCFPTKWNGSGPHPEAVESFPIGDGLPDVNDFKIKFGLIVPSTNTTVEYDFWKIIFKNEELCKGIGFHCEGILVEAAKLDTDEDMLEFLKSFRRHLYSTIDRVMTSEPQYIIMGMSAETFFGGWEGNKEFKKELTDRTGLNIGTGAEACKCALEKFNANKVAIITPYQEIGDKNVVKFFKEIGVDVVRIHGLKCGSATDIAHVPESWLEKCIKENLVVEGIDAIVQCGTNLSMVSLSDRLELELGIPFIPINAAILWFAMRECGIEAKLQGATRLFREH
jgi:maleate isomerase